MLQAENTTKMTQSKRDPRRQTRYSNVNWLTVV